MARRRPAAAGAEAGGDAAPSADAAASAERREAAAAMFLRFERALDAKPTHEIRAIAAALDTLRLVAPRAAGKHARATPTRGVLVVQGSGSLARRAIVQALALFLTWPRQSALFLTLGGAHLRPEESAAESRARKPKGGGAARTKRARRAEDVAAAAAAARRRPVAPLTAEESELAVGGCFLYPCVPRALRAPLPCAALMCSAGGVTSAEFAIKLPLVADAYVSRPLGRPRAPPPPPRSLRPHAAWPEAEGSRELQPYCAALGASLAPAGAPAAPANPPVAPAIPPAAPAGAPAWFHAIPQYQAPWHLHAPHMGGPTAPLVGPGPFAAHGGVAPTAAPRYVPPAFAIPPGLPPNPALGSHALYFDAGCGWSSAAPARVVGVPMGVPTHRPVWPAARASRSVGDRVKANCEEWSRYYDGVITQIDWELGFPLYTIKFDNNIPYSHRRATEEQIEQPWPAPQLAMQWYHSCAQAPAVPAHGGPLVDRGRAPELLGEPDPLAHLGGNVLDHARAVLQKIQRA